MNCEVKRDLGLSAYNFKHIVFPKMKHLIGGGDIVPVEAVTHSGFNKELDAYSGIDAWHVLRNANKIRGIASRVGHYRIPNFTIRLSRPSGARTEYQKRLETIEDINSGYLYPHLTFQAIVTAKKDGSFVSGAVMRTKDLFLFAKNLHEKKITPEGQDWGYGRTRTGEIFIFIMWDFIKRLGLPIKGLF